MGDITIALRAPVAGKRIERWVEQHVDSLRDAAWSRGVRLGRLWPAWRREGLDWLLEVDLRDRQLAPEDDPLLDLVLMEMTLLGLRPRVVERSHGALVRESNTPLRRAQASSVGAADPTGCSRLPL